jgi:hypothetical protein
MKERTAILQKVEQFLSFNFNIVLSLGPALICFLICWGINL